ncbi:J domain-containing protein [Psychrobacter aquaticus]|uniref:Heat shock protein DnaJ-like protein n=1 Tax=Psychrobacter aquaticus CMS 56 TaxID=1354303 RepID=U4T419_9GAMM|nr:J domain-containing protein [Psychrobacter aquaticus]ERL56052.1 heat shock protein DnaJ-like protein [Psychrobacter aquaticus CMS 56]
MNTLHTHYDTLMVSRSASPEVIRAAFKSLCQKYHPDKNNHADADRIMQQFNEAYSILSNPVERNKYDKQLLDYEENANQASQQKNYRHFSNEESSNTSKRKNNVVIINIPDSISFSNAKHHVNNFLSKAKPLLLKTLKVIFYIVILITLINVFVTYIGDSNSNDATNDLYDAQREVQDAARELDEAVPELDDYEDYSYVPDIPEDILDTSENTFVDDSELQQVLSTNYKTHAPNGEIFPSSANYVAGYPQLNDNGASILTIDNSQNTEAIFGKLYYLDETEDLAVRHFYIQGGGGFNIRNISPGYYDVRYKDLENGHISKSEPVLIEEYEDYDSVRFSEITMTLYKVSDGNMETYAIPENEF